MEIGFGSGEHLVAQATAHPDVGFIGCEPYVNGVAALLAKLEDRHLSNVRVYTNDARDLLAAVAAESLGRVFALYPDPWPKRKHHLRRLVSPPTLDLLARALRPRGELRLASDHMEYVRWMLNLTTSDPRFRWLARRPCDWRTRPADGFETRYEQKAALKGSVSVYLRFERLSGSVAGAVLEKTLCALGVGLYTEMMSRAV
jgi:tRNA (guanine-N7-)-methyltransferase